MQTINIYVADREQPISINVGEVTSGYTPTSLSDAITFEDESGNKGRIYINKEQVIAVVITPSEEGGT